MSSLSHHQKSPDRSKDIEQDYELLTNNNSSHFNSDLGKLDYDQLPTRHTLNTSDNSIDEKLNRVLGSPQNTSRCDNSTQAHNNLEFSVGEIQLETQPSTTLSSTELNDIKTKLSKVNKELFKHSLVVGVMMMCLMAVYLLNIFKIYEFWRDNIGFTIALVEMNGQRGIVTEVTINVLRVISFIMVAGAGFAIFWALVLASILQVFGLIGVMRRKVEYLAEFVSICQAMMIIYVNFTLFFLIVFFVSLANIATPFRDASLMLALNYLQSRKGDRILEMIRERNKYQEMVSLGSGESVMV